MVERFRASAAAAKAPETKDPKTGQFQKGAPRLPGAGREKGKPNKNTVLIKDAISGACERLGELEPIWQKDARGRKIKIIGWKPTGKGGAMGYMIWLGCNYPSAFAALVSKMIPLQLTATQTVDMTVTSKFSDAQIGEMTLAEKLATFREMIGLTRALPPPEPSDALSARMIEGESTREEE